MAGARDGGMHNYVLYAATVLIWGTTWYGIKLQLGVVAPEVSVAYRFAIASAVLFVWCAARGLKVRFSRREHGFAALLGFFLFAVNYELFYRATGSVTTGLVALSFSLMVLLNALFGALFLNSPLRPRVLLGGVLGIAGIGLVYWPEVAGLGGAHATAAGLALCVAATVSASLGNIVSARNQLAGMAVVQTNAVGMAYGAMFMALGALAAGRSFDFDFSVVYVGSLLYLAFFGSVVAFGCFLTLLGRIGADRAAYAMILHPLVAIAISTALEGFRWGWPAALGVALVFVGNVVVLSPPRRRRGFA